MNKKLLLILLVGVLFLSLSACSGTTAPVQTSIPTETSPPPTDVPDMDADEGHDADDDSQDDTDMDTDEGHDADDASAIDAAAIFSDRCASCHGEDRTGGGGPPLLPANLTKDPSAYVETIINGSGQMPSWEGRLSGDEINALVDFILSEVE